MNRRDFLRSAGAVAGSSFALGLPRLRAGRWLSADPPLQVGLVLPAGAPGEAVRRGVQMGVEEANTTAQLFGKSIQLTEADAGDSPGLAGERLVTEHGVFALIGGVGPDGALDVGRVADARKVLFLNVGDPADALRGRDCRRFTFHVAASAAMRSDAVAQGLEGTSFPRQWYFVHPPTAEGHALYGRGRAALLRAGGKDVGAADVAPDTNLAELFANAQKAGAEAVWVALQGPEQMRLAAAYRALAPAPAFQLAGPCLDEDAFRSVPADRRAGIWATMWYHERKPFGADSLSGRYLTRYGQPMDAAGWVGWLAPKILLESTERARSADPATLVSFLESERAGFDGHKGVPLSFRPWDHQLRQPLYLLRPRPQPPNPVDIFEVVADLPRRVPGDTALPAARLDRLGDGPGGGECHLTGAPGRAPG